MTKQIIKHKNPDAITIEIVKLSWANVFNFGNKDRSYLELEFCDSSSNDS